MSLICMILFLEFREKLFSNRICLYLVISTQQYVISSRHQIVSLDQSTVDGSDLFQTNTTLPETHLHTTPRYISILVSRVELSITESCRTNVFIVIHPDLEYIENLQCLYINIWIVFKHRA